MNVGSIVHIRVCILTRVHGIIQHQTTEDARAVDTLKQGLYFCRSQVVAGGSGIRASRKANEELGHSAWRVLLQPCHPAVEVDIGSIAVIEMCSSRTLRSVVELHPYVVEPSLAESTSKLSVRNHTLRRCCKQIALLRIRIHKSPKLFCKCGYTSIAILLDVKIETIHHIVTEWSRASVIARLRSEDLPKLIGKVDAVLVRGQSGIRNATTE